MCSSFISCRCILSNLPNLPKGLRNMTKFYLCAVIHTVAQSTFWTFTAPPTSLICPGRHYFSFSEYIQKSFFWHVSSFVWEIIFGHNFIEEAENDGGGGSTWKRLLSCSLRGLISREKRRWNEWNMLIAVKGPIWPGWIPKNGKWGSFHSYAKAQRSVRGNNWISTLLVCVACVGVQVCLYIS